MALMSRQDYCSLALVLLQAAIAGGCAGRSEPPAERYVTEQTPLHVTGKGIDLKAVERAFWQTKDLNLGNCMRSRATRAGQAAGRNL